MPPCLIKAICWIGPYRVEWKIPQTNINPEPDPAVCQEDERLREWRGVGGGRHSTSRKPVRGREGNFGKFGESSLFLFCWRSPLWYRKAGLWYLHGRLPCHTLNGPSWALTSVFNRVLNCQSYSCLEGCHHHKLPLCGAHFDSLRR